MSIIILLQTRSHLCVMIYSEQCKLLAITHPGVVSQSWRSLLRRRSLIARVLPGHASQTITYRSCIAWPCFVSSQTITYRSCIAWPCFVSSQTITYRSCIAWPCFVSSQTITYRSCIAWPCFVSSSVSRSRSDYQRAYITPRDQ